MGRKIGASSPEIINIEPTPLLVSRNIESVGLLEQLFYYNDNSYVPDRTDTPLTLVPTISVYDPDSKETIVPTFTVEWRVFTPTADGGTVINSTSTSDDFYRSGKNLVVRKNIPYNTPYKIKCTFTYTDSRTTSVTNIVEKEVLLSTIMESDIVYPKLNIKAANTNLYNPVDNTNNGLFTFVAEAHMGDTDVTSQLYYVWYARKSVSDSYEPIDALDSNNNYKFQCYEFATQPSGKGQGTDTIVLNAMFVEDLQIMLMCKPSSSGNFYPDRVYSNLNWKYPQMDIATSSKCGDVVKQKGETLEFENTITIVPTDTMTDAQKLQHLRFKWYVRDVTLGDSYKVDYGFAQVFSIKSDDLWSNSKTNRNVYCEAYFLGASEKVTLNGVAVTSGGSVLTTRILSNN